MAKAKGKYRVTKTTEQIGATNGRLITVNEAKLRADFRRKFARKAKRRRVIWKAGSAGEVPQSPERII